MIRIAEQLGFMKERVLTVCTKAEIGRKVRRIESCSRTIFSKVALKVKSLDNSRGIL